MRQFQAIGQLSVNPAPGLDRLALPLLGPIEGRSGDFITLPGERVINGLLRHYISRLHVKSGEVREYQVVEMVGTIELRVRPGGSWSEETHTKIETEVAQGLGVAMRLAMLVPFVMRS